QADENRRREEPLQGTAILRPVRENPFIERVVDVPPGDDQHSRTREGFPGLDGERRRRGSLDPDACGGVLPHGGRELCLGHDLEALHERIQLGHCERDRHTNRETVRKGRAPLRIHGAAGPPALVHRRRLGGGDRDPERAGCALGHRTEDPDRERAVSDRHDHGAGWPGDRVEQLVADRLVALELRRLRAVLEEEGVPLLREGACGLLRLVDVGADMPELRSLRLDQSNLRGARTLRDEDDAAHARAAGGPRSRGAVVPGRGGDDDVRPSRFEDRDRTAPFERSELVLVLALEPDAVAKRLEAGHARCGSTDRGLTSRARTPYAASPAPRAINPPSKIQLAPGALRSLIPLSSRIVPSASRSTRSGRRTVKRLEISTPGIEPVRSHAVACRSTFPPTRW